MIVECVRMVADWLVDGTKGVAAVLATLPIDVADVRPATVNVADATRDQDVAVGRPANLATGLSGISVTLESMADESPDATGIRRDAKVTLLVRYDGRHSNAATAQTNAGYVLRATLISLQNFWGSGTDTQRTRNGVQIVAPLQTMMKQVTPRADTDPVMAGILIEMQVRDNT